jgi:hypothetical protein
MISLLPPVVFVMLPVVGAPVPIPIAASPHVIHRNEDAGGEHH